jgi:exopolysaccharide biosynthesis WecB/TagA/CpsF family protein
MPHLSPHDGNDRRRGERRSRPRSGPDRRALTVEGVTINVPSMDEAVSSVIAAAQQRRGFCLYTLNLDHIAQLRSRPDFRDAYDRARFVTADGFPIVMLGRLIGADVSRTTGADLVEPVCEQARQAGLSVFLLGSDDETLTKCAERLRQRFKNLRVAGSYAPSRNFDPNSHEADVAIGHIRASGARLCFIALGAPKQELFAARCLDSVPEVGFLCIGAALDFIAGRQTRAPRLAQKTGLEWAWRMIGNPRRLGPRYARCLAQLPRLVALALPQILQSRMKDA